MVQKTRASGAPAPPPLSSAAGEITSLSKTSRVNVAEIDNSCSSIESPKDLVVSSKMVARVLSLLLLACAGATAFQTAPTWPSVSRRGVHANLRMRGEDGNKKDEMGMMQRPVLDNAVTKALYSLEALRVKMAKETPSEENGGWSGEPKEWANEDSLVF